MKTGRLPMGNIKELLRSHEIVMAKLASGAITPVQAMQMDFLQEDDPSDHWHRYSEFLCHFQSRMGPLTPQPEIQANHFLLPRGELPQPRGNISQIHVFVFLPIRSLPQPRSSPERHHMAETRARNSAGGVFNVALASL